MSLNNKLTDLKNTGYKIMIILAGLLIFYVIRFNTENNQARQAIIGTWVSEDSSQFGGAEFETIETSHFYESGEGVILIVGKMSFGSPDSNQSVLPPMSMSSNTEFKWSMASNILYTTTTSHKSVGLDLSSKMFLTKSKLQNKEKLKSSAEENATQIYYIQTIEADQIKLKKGKDLILLRKPKPRSNKPL